jgi:hypothetical protein
MEVGQTGVRADISAQRELWNLVKARRVALAQRQEGQAFVEQRLGSLLLGRELSPAEQGEYVRRLAGTADLAQRLSQDLEVPALGSARVPRELLAWKAGGVGWRPFPVTQKVVNVTPLHRRLQDRMAIALKNKLASAPESARTCLQAVGITVERGSFRSQWNDQDRVELSGWGMEMLVLEDQLRSAPVLPAPRFLFATMAPTSGGVIASSNR